MDEGLVPAPNAQLPLYVNGKQKRDRSTYLIFISCFLAAMGIVITFFLVEVGNRETATGAQVRKADFPLAYCQARFMERENYQTPENAQLLHVQVVTRHGDRTPCTAVPNEDVEWNCDQVNERVNLGGLDASIKFENDNHVPSPFLKGSCFVGQLTERGVEQHKLLGKKLRSIYSQHLNLSPDRVYARSTTVPRTRQSAHALLSGLVRRGSGPVTVHQAVHVEHDYLKPSERRCKRIGELEKELRSSPHWQKHLTRMGKDMKAARDALGVDESMVEYKERATKFSDAFLTRMCHDKPFPCSETQGGCVSYEIAERLNNASVWEWRQKYGSYDRKEKARLNVGPLFGRIVGEMKSRSSEMSKTHKSQLPSFYLYSAHDHTIAGVLGALEMSQFYGWPPYASSVVFELWRAKDKSHFVRVLYNGELATRYGSCTQSQCALDDFLQYVDKEIVPKDFNAECGQTNE